LALKTATQVGIRIISREILQSRPENDRGEVRQSDQNVVRKKVSTVSVSVVLKKAGRGFQKVVDFG
jgi:hypothetical protein